MVQALCWLLPPSVLKNMILRWFGHDISPTASIGPTVVLNVGHVSIGAEVRISLFNVFRGLSNVILEDHVIIESWNWISAHPLFQEVDPKAGTLFVANHGKIGSRNYVDCSGTIVVREHARVGGNRCLLQTHQANQQSSQVGVGRITVGHHSVVGSCAVLLKGSFLPDQSMLAANSTMTHRTGIEGRRGLYAGTPAVWKRETGGAYFEGSAAYDITDAVADEPMGILAADVVERSSTSADSL
jgi:acetyltransferase-like isoleucine patch superfamily enzyme